MVDASQILPRNGGDGSLGFVLNGDHSGGNLGASVAMDGDIDGDGRDDLLAGVPGFFGPDATVLVFGDPAAPMGPDGMEMADIIDGEIPEHVARIGVAFPDSVLFGHRVRMLGDLDGDGYEDFGIGSGDLEGDFEDGTGEVFVIYGGPGAGDTLADFTGLLPGNGGTGEDGFVITGFSEASFLGKDFFGKRDINGDGNLDLLVLTGTEFEPGRGNGMAFVLYGRGGRSFPPLITFDELETMPPEQGFRLVPPEPEGTIPDLDPGFVNTRFIHDVNGDDLPEILMCRQHPQFADTFENGECYLVFGRAGPAPFPALLDLGSLLERNGGDGSEGLVILGSRDEACLGSARGASVQPEQVAGIGDFDGDGRNDFLIGAPGCNAPPRAYIFFGQEQYPAELDLRDLVAGESLPVRITTLLPFIEQFENDGFSRGLGAVGDVNSDGRPDIAVSATFDQPLDRNGSWVLFGRTDPPELFNMGELLPENGGDGSQGFLVQDFPTEEDLGRDSISAGDFNGDGVPDMVFGGRTMDPGGRSNAGRAVVLFGRRPPVVEVPGLNRWGMVLLIAGMGGLAIGAIRRGWLRSGAART